MIASARTFAAHGVAALGWRLAGFGRRLQEHGPKTADERTLAGDRDIEWTWCLGRLPSSPGVVLDFGAGGGILSVGAAFRGHRVVAVDLEPCAFPFELGEIEYRQGDFNELEFAPDSFDYVMNCSTIEHVGLSGRYAGSRDDPDADLRAMERLASLLRRGGEMALTIPVGRDAVFPPLHRVYGAERLPQLLESFDISAERFWAKPQGVRWQEVDKRAALDVEGSESYYALGLFALRRR